MNTLQITPFMHVRDLAAAIAFMEEVLGNAQSIAGVTTLPHVILPCRIGP
jgi:hypothetical protein